MRSIHAQIEKDGKIVLYTHNSTKIVSFGTAFQFTLMFGITLWKQLKENRELTIEYSPIMHQ